MQIDDQGIHKSGVQMLLHILGKQEMDSAELIANVSDALRTPLTAIKGYAETLLRHEQRLSEQERHEFLQIIKEASDKLAKTITDLLNVSPAHKQTDASGFLKNHRQGVEVDQQQPVQERQQAFEEFHQRLQQQAEAFGVFRQVFEDKLCILREQRRTVRAIPDPTQRQQAFQELQTVYLQLQQDLWEQHAIYRQLRLDYQAHCTLLYAQKPVR